MTSSVGQTEKNKLLLLKLCFRESQSLVLGWKRRGVSQLISPKEIIIKDKLFLLNFQCSMFILKNGSIRVCLYLKALKSYSNMSQYWHLRTKIYSRLLIFSWLEKTQFSKKKKKKPRVLTLMAANISGTVSLIHLFLIK